MNSTGHELLAAIVDSSKDPTIGQNLDGVIVAWNTAAEVLLGYKAEQAVGQPFTSIAADLSQLDLVSIIQRLRAGELIHDLKSVFKLQDGTLRPVLLDISLLRTRENRLLGIAAIVKPASGAREPGHDLFLLNAELLQSERRFRVLSEALADMLWAAGPCETAPRYLGPQFGQYTGLGPELLTSETWQRLLHPEDRVVAQQAWLPAREAEQRFEVEFRLRRFDGAYRWFVARGTPVRDDHGDIVQWVGTCTDVDNLKRGEEALRRSNKELKQFAYAAAHDLQEPLRNVATSVGMLRRHYQSKLDPSGMEWIEASVEGAHRLYAMVKDLLTFSTIIDDDADPTEDADIAAHSAVEAALVELSTEVEAAAPDIQIGELPRLAIKRTHAIRLFQNIIGNSLKYRRTDVRPSIEISAIPSGTEWTLSVKDNGIGFDPVYAAKIFGVFKRLHGRETYSGNGIGLAICERIVAHYGGRIWAEASPGLGATFHFCLPAVPAET